MVRVESIGCRREESGEASEGTWIGGKERGSDRMRVRWRRGMVDDRHGRGRVWMRRVKRWRRFQG